MHLVHPDYYVKRVQDIDLDFLLEKGIKLIIFDIDNTLASHNGREPAKGIKEWIDKIINRGFLCCLVSNNNKKRVCDFNKHFSFYTVHRAMKPLRRGFLKAAKHMNVKPHEACVVGDQIFSDILGANLAGMMSILVDRISNNGEGKFIHFKRWLEKYLLHKYKYQHWR